MIFVLIKNDGMIDDILDLMIFWDAGCAGQHVKSKIISEARYINIAAATTAVFGVLSVASFVYPNTKESDTVFLVRLQRDWLPFQNIFLDIFLKLALCVIGFVSTAHAFHMLYITQHIKFQLYMLNEYIGKMGDRDDDESVYDEAYQEEIGFRIKFCIKRHNEAIG
jgi:hypothetical protein